MSLVLVAEYLFLVVVSLLIVSSKGFLDLVAAMLEPIVDMPAALASAAALFFVVIFIMIDTVGARHD